MRFELLANIDQFENLQKGDCILVKWSEYWVKHNQGAKKVMLYNIYENKSRCDEIICQKKYNHFFNYKMHVEGKSVADEVYIVKL